MDKIKNCFNLLEDGLSGSEIINRLQKGHVIRRSAWIDGIYIRIVNECGYDNDGKIIVTDHDTLYTSCTNGYFLHLGYSRQPLKNPKIYRSRYGVEISTRSGEGMGMLFMNDWEDYGFMTGDEFEKIRLTYKDDVYKFQKEWENGLLWKYMMKHE